MGKTKVRCNLPEAIDLFRYHYGVELEKVIKYTMASLITTFIKLAPPRTKKEGTHSIDMDLSRVFLNTKYFADNFSSKNPAEQERVRGYFKSKDFESLEALQKTGAILKHVRFKPFDKSDIVRNNRGRIFKTGSKIIATDPKAFKDYVKTLKANVGELKGSFITSLEHFGGGSYPGWIKKNSKGYFEDNSKPKNTLGVQGASAISNVEYGDSVDRRMDLVRRTYYVQSGKLVGMVQKNVLNKALTKYFDVPEKK